LLAKEHRSQLRDLEGIVAHVRSLVGTENRVDDGVGLETLLDGYVRLAFAHYSVSGYLFRQPKSGRVDDDDEPTLACHHQATTAASPESIVPIDRRLAETRARVQALQLSRCEILALEHDLEAIVQRIRWTRDHCAAAHIASVRAQVNASIDGTAYVDETFLHQFASLQSSMPLAALNAPPPSIPPGALRIALSDGGREVDTGAHSATDAEQVFGGRAWRC
jgi:hypothetical protein